MEHLKNPYVGLEGYNCFGCAPHNPIGLHMEFYEDGDDVVAKWQPHDNVQGWLDTLHGGVQATLADEICGWVISRKFQTAGVTSRMEIRYLKPVRISAGEVTLRAHVVGQKRNFIEVEAVLFDGNGNECTKVVCSFFIFPQERAREQFHFCDCLTDAEAAEKELTTEK